MLQLLSRRKFLKLGSTALIAAILASDKALTFADEGDLIVYLRSVTIPESVQLLNSLVKFYGTRSNISIKMRLLSRQQLSDALAEATQAGSGPDVLESSYLQA